MLEGATFICAMGRDRCKIQNSPFDQGHQIIDVRIIVCRHGCDCRSKRDLIGKLQQIGRRQSTCEEGRRGRMSDVKLSM